jgi:uncharacterized protein (TIGR02271 family)
LIWILAAAALLLFGAVYFLAARPARSESPEARNDTTIQLRAEELQVRKRREQLADVTTRHEVSQELKTVTVPVTREELVVEKDGVEAVRIPLCEEQVDVTTRTVPLNAVSVYRREWEEQQTVDAVLRKEVARVETTGTAQITDATAGAEENQPRA